MNFEELTTYTIQQFKARFIHFHTYGIFTTTNHKYRQYQKRKKKHNKKYKKPTYAYTYIKNAYFNKKHSDMSAKKNAHRTETYITLCNFIAHFNFICSHFSPQYDFFIFLIDKTE